VSDLRFKLSYVLLLGFDGGGLLGLMVACGDRGGGEGCASQEGVGDAGIPEFSWIREECPQGLAEDESMFCSI